MDYKEFVEHPDFSSHKKVAEWVETAATVIVKLLSRAEAAEARAEKAQSCIEEVNTAILLKSKTEALNAIKRWREGKEE